MADLDPVDPVRDALAGLAARPDRPADAVLADLRPAMGRARLHRRVHVASMTAAAAAFIVVGGISLRSPTEAQQVQIADETSGPEETLTVPETTEVVSDTTVAPSTTVPPTTIVSPATTMVSPSTDDVVPAPDGDPSTTPSPEPAPEPTSVPAVTTPPALLPTTAPEPPPPPAPGSQSMVIPVPGAGTITVEYTPTTITEVDVTTTGGYTYEIEDRTVHEVKVKFEDGGPDIEVEVHLEDGEITYQIDGDESES